MFNHVIRKTTILCLTLIPLSCSADEKLGDSIEQTLVHTYLSKSYSIAKPGKPVSIQGDFNADGYLDTALLFIPDQAPEESSKIKIVFPWVYPNTQSQTGTLRTSLAIFHGTSGDNSKSIIPPVYCLLDRSGVLETPSFELLVSHRNDQSYALHAEMFAETPKGDLIIIPTEAGIDTYVYWDSEGYKLYEPEEMP